MGGHVLRTERATRDALISMGPAAQRRRDRGRAGAVGVPCPTAVRPLLLLLVLLPLAIGIIAAFAWVQAGQDRYAALEEEGMALARVLRGTAAESALTVRSAEHNLAGRLSAVAAYADLVIAGTRAPAADLLASVAENRDIGQIFLFDASGEPIAYVQWPPAVAGGAGALLTPERKAELQWRDARAAQVAGTPAAGQVVVEGLRTNVFATRERFGVLYGRVAGGTLLLRANARELSTLRSRFGLDPLLEHYVDVPSVVAVRIWGRDGGLRLARGLEVAPDPASALPPELGEDGRVVLAGPYLRALLPAGTAGEPLVVEVRLGREVADEALAASRRSIVLSALLALALALGGGFLLLVREAAERRATARAAAKLEEERRLAEMGALAGLVTHEVNNPLNAIRIALGVLEGDPSEADRAAVHATMKDEVARMAATLDGYMALASSDRRAKRRVGPAILAAVRARVAAEVRERSVTLGIDVVPGARDVLCDPVVLEQALANLVRNALQASPERATVKVRWADAGPGEVQITVADDGPGFPEDRRTLLRLGGHHRADGHGLGLPLAKRFIETHGGRLTLENGPDGGAYVTVRLPAAAEERGDDV